MIPPKLQSGDEIRMYKLNDTDEPEISDEDRCPLPARGDWFQFIVATADKS